MVVAKFTHLLLKITLEIYFKFPCISLNTCHYKNFCVINFTFISFVYWCSIFKDTK